MNEIQKKLFSMQDKKYKDFHCKLIPTVDKDKIIGVRTPELRKYAKEISCNSDIHKFLNKLPHEYYEENNLHAFIIETVKNYDEALEKTERFLPYIDNWATCDMFCPRVFAKNTEKLEPSIEKWIKSGNTYSVRFGICMLMKLYLDENFKAEYPELVLSSQCDDYYVNMVIAWYFATALAKHYDEIIPYLKENRLDTWVHNKTIQKAIESRRISPEQKQFLRSLKNK